MPNDYIGYAAQALNAQQQSALSGDKKLQDFYGSEVTRGVLQAANAQMKENERVAYENQRMMREQQTDFMRMVNDQMSEINAMRMQLELERLQFEHTCWFSSLTPEQRETYLEEQRIKGEERLEAEKLDAERRQREQGERDREWEEAWQKEQKRRASLTPFQRKKEDILNADSEFSDRVCTVLGVIIAFGLGGLGAIIF